MRVLKTTLFLVVLNAVALSALLALAVPEWRVANKLERPNQLSAGTSEAPSDRKEILSDLYKARYTVLEHLRDKAELRMQAMAKDPIGGAMIHTNETTMRRRYGPLVRRLRLSSTAAESFEKLIALRNIRVEIPVNLPAEYENVEGIPKSVRFDNEDWDKKIGQLLSHDEYRDYIAYNNTLEARTFLESFGTQANTDSVAGDQFESVVDLVARSRIAELPGSDLPLEKIETEFDEKIKVINAITSADLPSLAAEQVDAVKTALLAEVESRRLNFQIAKRRNALAEERKPKT